MTRRDRCASARPADSRPQGPATLSQSVGRAPPRRSALSVVYRKPDGGGKVPGSRERGRGCGRDDSQCLLATPTTPALGRDARRRRAFELRTGVRCACQVWWCSRPGRAPRRTGIAAEAIRCCGANAAAEYARANEVLCGALWPQPAAQQALQQVSVSLLHVLAADLGAALARWRPCRPSVVPGPLQRRLLGSAPRPAPAHLTNTPTLTSTSGAKRPETESRRRRAGPRPRGAAGVLPEDAKKTRVALQNLAPGMNWP